MAESMKKQLADKVQETGLPTHSVTDLAQIRALADPLRLRIIGALGGAPRTTKQVADILGEKPTKLYHHMEALERVGLIRLMHTRPNRGTIEKYYQAVASRFEVSSSALSPDVGEGEKRSAQEAMLTSILENAQKELLATLRPESPACGDPADAPIVVRVTMIATQRKLQSVRKQLLRWIEKLRSVEGGQGETGKSSAADKVTYTFTAVLCRTDSK
jgi:DNA-binding transcriptional ArsR family regulator